MYSFYFHRQKPLLNYIVDFYCYELNLVIEIDGMYHNDEEKCKTDDLRDEELGKFDLVVMRFAEREVRKNMIDVLRTIETYIEKHTPNPSQGH